MIFNPFEHNCICSKKLLLSKTLTRSSRKSRDSSSSSQLRDDFQESVAMSSYLVAFVVCDFKRVSQLTRRNVSVSVYAAEAMLPQATYAVKTASKTMDFFESFFGAQYPLPKLGKYKILFLRINISQLSL